MVGALAKALAREEKAAGIGDGMRQRETGK